MKSLLLFILKIITLVILFPLVSIPTILLLKFINTGWLLVALCLLQIIKGAV